jgi:hypothetical protein
MNHINKLPRYGGTYIYSNGPHLLCEYLTNYKYNILNDNINPIPKFKSKPKPINKIENILTKYFKKN